MLPCYLGETHMKPWWNPYETLINQHLLFILHVFSTRYLVTLVKPTWNLDETHMKPWLISTCYWFCTFSTHETHMKPWSIGTLYWFFTFSAHETLMKPIWNLDQLALIIHFAHFQYTLPCYLGETHMKPWWNPYETLIN